MIRASAATTRSATPGRVHLSAGALFLNPAQVITSPETAVRYRIESFLAAGGFGQVYLARRISRSPDIPETVCIKVSGQPQCSRSVDLEEEAYRINNYSADGFSALTPANIAHEIALVKGSGVPLPEIDRVEPATLLFP